MNYVIRGNNLEVTDALREFIEKKLSRLEKYFEKPTDAHVALSVQKDHHKVEVTIPYPGLLVRAEEVSDDMYVSVDLVIEKLERQIRKYKTKVNRKLRQDGSLRSLQKENAFSIQSVATATVEQEESDFEIVRRKQFELKPMDTEEAILQMDLLGHNFFVFINAETDQVNVIYKRKDGKYGLIEPE
ncbi:ribosome hibernation-promoting factor, HPF/YfiA family [Thermoflavimicrobium dichotomicum]|uniref:Ribosome hibernation promoting factor n=1 Tax=Thermoflavimicrobium dichotomicum TaxID=46223 RepID=A0A1I3JX15_9BACL|nr:ribosome-associated translation inhibitor RaiA [Thermoflavimicrobium dichotomicum]SFI64792.1 putative sigma-54 modulation protein [Thermoflavimicrobium dichotomicum]